MKLVKMWSSRGLNGCLNKTSRGMRGELLWSKIASNNFIKSQQKNRCGPKMSEKCQETKARLKLAFLLQLGKLCDITHKYRTTDLT